MEWLRIYSDAILTQDVSFEKVMANGELVDVEQRNDEHWRSSAQAARFIVQVRDAAAKCQGDYAADVESYLMNNEDLNLPSQVSIF